MTCFTKIFLGTLLWYPSFSTASAVAEEVYEIRSAFVSRYTCYIEVQERSLPERGLMIGVPCRQYLKKFRGLENNLRKYVSYNDFFPINITLDKYLRWAIILQLREELEGENSPYGRLLKSTVLGILEG